MKLFPKSITKPFLVAVIPGKRQGYIIIKIGKLYYECIQSYTGKRWTTLRCKEYRRKNQGGHGCRFTVRVRNISGVTEKENAELFWRKESWEIVEVGLTTRHCCHGILSDIWQRDMKTAITSPISETALPATSLSLPDVVMLRIMKYLSLENICQIRQVCLVMIITCSIVY